MLTKWIFPDYWQIITIAICSVLHQRSEWRLAAIIAGIVFAKKDHNKLVQSLRYYRTNVGAFHLNMWVHTMVELWAWQKRASAICDRSDSPWDDIERRPPHADRCQALRQAVLSKTFFDISGHSRKNRKIVRQLYKLMKLAA